MLQLAVGMAAVALLCIVVLLGVLHSCPLDLPISPVWQTGQHHHGALQPCMCHVAISSACVIVLQYPLLVAHHARIAELPGVKEYLASPLRLEKVNNNNLG